MKNKLFTIIAASLVAAGSSQGAVYVITNSISDTATIGITEQDGKPGAGAVVKGFNTTDGFGTYGYFTNLTDLQIMASTDGSDLMSNFVRFGTAGANFSATTLGANGTLSMTNSDLDVGGAAAAFEGKSMYFVITNVSSFAAITDSAQFLILKHNTETFDATDDIPATKSVTFSDTTATLLVGGFNNYQFKIRTADATAGPAWNTVALGAVPEPSAALLGALGALGLLRRRRN